MALLETLVTLSRDLAGTRSRLSKIRRMADYLRALPADQVPLAVAYLHGTLRQGRIGVGPALIRDVMAMLGPAGSSPKLSLQTVDRALDAVAALRGAGSAAARRERLVGLLGAATEPEREYLVRLLLGELRQGALEGVLVDALAAAWDLTPAALRRAVMVAGNPAPVATAVAERGSAALAEFRLELMNPLKPMLAQTAQDPAAALADLGEAAFEYKLDGARIQVHKQDDEVRVYTRQLHEVTSRVPEAVERVAALPARTLVLDGEAIALRSNGAPLPFQVTMRRFGRRLGVEQSRRELPLSVFFFDCLHADGDDLLDLSGAERYRRLVAEVPRPARVRRMQTDDPTAAQAFLSTALAAGHEGVMAKSLAALYEAGNRGSAWLKIKPTHTADLVVLAVEWGSGRRRGWLSNLHLGARDGDGGFVMVGKTFKGLTDELLGWQTQALLAREVAREGAVVRVRPELVVEIAFDGVQDSVQYPGGLALRFARVRGYRADKTAEDADTIEFLRSIQTVQRARGE